MWKHPQVIKKWVSFCQGHNIQSIKFARDVPTRWSSTYKLLCQSDEYKELLYDFMRYNVSSTILYPQQWHMCTKIYQLLNFF